MWECNLDAGRRSQVKSETSGTIGYLRTLWRVNWGDRLREADKSIHVVNGMLGNRTKKNAKVITLR